MSCTKDISSIGLNLQDRDDLLNAVFTDTTTLTAYSVLEDSLNTTNLVSNYLGHFKDEVFGTTTSSIYTQLIPSGNNVSFGDSPQLDSIVLTLRYTGGYYGDTLNPFSIKVYELSDDIVSTTTYYQHSSIGHKPDNLTFQNQFTLLPKPKTKVRLDTIYEAHVRIRLSQTLGQDFLNNASKMATPDDFKKFFKGILIAAEPSRNNGSLVNFSLTSSLTGIHLYYKNGETKKQFSFIIRSPEATRFNNYIHNYQTGDSRFVNQVINKDSLLGKETLYIQSMAGVKTKITFPHLKHLKDRKIVINKAELVITNIEDQLNLFPTPTKLGMQGINPKGETVFVPDDAVFTNTTYWGGTYDASKKEYRFRVTRLIQDLIKRDNFKPYVFLVADGAAAHANRLIFCGYQPFLSPAKLRLDIYYTEY